MGRAESIWVRVQHFVGRPWYMALVALLAGLDLFVMVIPTDGLLVTSVLCRPKKWVGWCLSVSIGSALGAVALAALLHIDPHWIKHGLMYGAFQTEAWFQTEAFIGKHGGWALAVVAMSILPQQPAVGIAALGGMTLVEIGVAVFLGRAAKYSVLCYLTSKSPAFVRRVWFLRRELEHFESYPANDKRPLDA